jgi:GlpG protein
MTDSQSPAVATAVNKNGHKQTRASLTTAMVVLCILVWTVFQFPPVATGTSFLRLFVLPVEEIRSGGYWTLITSNFLHLELWHLAGNVYWLWAFSSVIERKIGRKLLLIFVLSAALVSSLFQIAHLDTTGIGASGIVYAMFGLLWSSRRHVVEFARALPDSRVSLCLGWMGICVVVDYLNVMSVGNAAHIFGLLFGSLVGFGCYGELAPRIFRMSAAGLIALGIVPLFWCPWSASWLSETAYQAHLAEDFDSAIAWYSRLIARDPGNAWAYLNRSSAYEAIGDLLAAQADYDAAIALDPDVLDAM